MNLIWLSLFLVSLWANWRDFRSGVHQTHQWVIPKVSRRRVAVLIACILSQWIIVGGVILVSGEGELSQLASVLMVLTMLSLQVALARRSEFFQARGVDAAGKPTVELDSKDPDRRPLPRSTGCYILPFSWQIRDRATTVAFDPSAADSRWNLRYTVWAEPTSTWPLFLSRSR